MWLLSKNAEDKEALVTDDLTRALEQLSGELPEPRTTLTEAEKDQLVARIGPRTVRSIVKAKAECPLQRIPFLFSTLNTQDVVDVLANDLKAALERALTQKAKSSR